MNLLELTRDRYSCRAYTDEPVAPQQLEYILECARLAPSAVNKQPWKFRIVTSREGKDKLRQCYKREWFATAPMYILGTVLHDEEWVRRDGKAHGNIDIAIATEHICLAATEQGLGSCWVCAFHADLCHELFQLPENEEAAVIIPLGHPAGEPAEKIRKSLDEIVVRDV